MKTNNMTTTSGEEGWVKLDGSWWSDISYIMVLIHALIIDLLYQDTQRSIDQYRERAK